LAARPGFVASQALARIEYLAAPGRSMRLVIGADILGETTKWHRWDEVVAAAPLIVIGRGGHALPPGSTATEITMPEISASRVRDLLAAGASAGGPITGEVSGLVPASVLRYIAEHELYKP
jgi:nicotinic acid mononucleotide adenylyltransferase